MKSYLVGGAVRDRLLELPMKDRDWVVVGAEPQAMAAAGYRQVGKDFPVFIHPQSGEEYALARTERKTGKGYKGFEFYSAADVTLEEDLQRRDLTINAIAQADDGELIDPYGGVADIAARKLRHVSPAFSEDPLRVLRVARFAARFAHLGFSIADETLALMAKIVERGELQHLVAERVWQEMELALATPNPEVFFTSLREVGGLNIILPEVDALFGVPQPAKYHPEIDTGVHVMMCLQQAAKLSPDTVVRYATLVHDVGKALTKPENWPSHYGHETLGLPALDAINKRLKLPSEHATIARLVCELHTKLHRLSELRAKTVLDLLMRLDAFRRPERMQKFLLSCEADSRGRTGFEDCEYPQRKILQTLCAAAEAVDIPGLLANERPKDIPAAIHDARLRAIKAAMPKIPELQGAR